MISALGPAAAMAERTAALHMIGPELVIADGALGLWQAVEEVWPKTQQSKAKRALQEIWMAETKKDALVAFAAFVETWGAKYDRRSSAW